MSFCSRLGNLGVKPDILKVVNSCYPLVTYREQDPAESSSSSSEFLIRTAQQRDLLSLAEILADSFHDRTGIMRWTYPLLRMGIYEDLRSRLRSTSPHYVCLVAVDPRQTDSNSPAGTVAGTVEMALRSPYAWQGRGTQYPYISNLAVRKSHRRRGIAQKLLLTCEQTSREWGFPDLYLHVLENNQQARQLYFKLGYRLHEIDSGWSSWLLRHPRRLFLHKTLES